MTITASSYHNNDAKSARFPFDCIIVTSPDAASAQSAKGPLERILQPRLLRDYPSQTIRIVSTYDPLGSRCGSGGGTLACLEEFCEPTETVLILHAGGDSSRCPTQMILGKAWTSLPCHSYRNPTIWLIDQLQKLYEHANFPKGTLVVAATDCLATFFHVERTSGIEHQKQQQPKWSYTYSDESVVLGVAVPAPVTTAKNHGVYIISQEIVESSNNSNNTANSSSSFLGLEDPLDVWQKPSVEKLLTTTQPAPASFEVSARSDEQQKQAWIDTGIVIFLPKAVRTLYELSDGVLSLCTRKGLQAAYNKGQQQQQQQKLDTNQTLEEFAQGNALKIDLYTDILHNLSWPTQQYNGNPSPLRQVLSQLPLQILVAPQGRFLHLGTTQELVDFCTSGAYPKPTVAVSKSNTATTAATTIAALSKHLPLQPRFQCWSTPYPLNHNVALQSTFPHASSTTSIRIGKASFVEYCDLEGYQSVDIGHHSMLSGWRNNTAIYSNSTTSKVSSSLHIPSNLSVQLLTLKNNVSSSTKHANIIMHAYMVLGMQDGTKTARQDGTMYGMPIPDFLQQTGVSLEALGWKENNEKQDNLWLAELHPLVPAGTSFGSVFGWLSKLVYSNSESYSSIADEPSLKEWIALPRVSLKELHSLADAQAEWTYRLEMETKITKRLQEDFAPQLQRLLRERCHDQPCDWQWIIEMQDRQAAIQELSKVLVAVEEVARQELGQERYDICGRAFMIASAILADFAAASSTGRNANQQVVDEIIQFCSTHISKLRSSSTRHISRDEQLDAFDKIAEHRKMHMKKASLEDSLAPYSQIMERLAFCTTELSIADGFHKRGDKILTRRDYPPVKAKWVMAMAPARVDLAGAWSDTPPVCYEFGGSVTGMAVIVDDHVPLSCRCRILPGEKGVLLRTDIRSGQDGSLKTFLRAEVSAITDLSDFRDPLSDCALVKSSLVCLGLVTEAQIQLGSELQPLINKFCSCTEDVRIEIVTTSLLPHGSGMGTSSILGGCILASIAKCVGLGQLDDDFMLHAVLMLEQLLSSGGGWQDQAHGIIPGLKTVRSSPSQLPLVMSVERLEMDATHAAQLEKRLVLAFTGKTRLAKNILQNVLRRWARRTHEIVAAVERLLVLSEEARAAISNGDLDVLGQALFESSELKVIMAGEDSGAQPESVKKLVTELMAQGVIEGACLCGAGGGGFMMMIASEGYDKNKVSDKVQKELLSLHEDLEHFTWHECRICYDGLTTHIIDNENVDQEAFNLAWQHKRRQGDNS